MRPALHLNLTSAADSAAQATVQLVSSSWTHSSTFELTTSQGTATLSTGSVKVSVGVGVLEISSKNTTYDYYIKVGSAVTTTSDVNRTVVFGIKVGDTVQIYVKERYTINYAGAHADSGTVPTKQYKIHGTSVTLATNSLTRASYTANGWSAYNGTNEILYSNGASYSLNESVNLYANWTPKVSTINAQVMVWSDSANKYQNSSVGAGTVRMNYIADDDNTDVAITRNLTTATTSVPSVLVGNQVSFSANNLSVGGKSCQVSISVGTNTSVATGVTSFTPTQQTTYTVYVYVTPISSNQLKYDSVDKYFYFEDGEYPQSYVGNSLNTTLNDAATTTSLTKQYDLVYIGRENVKLPIYKYTDGKKYARAENNGQTKWFVVEPIRWRVSDYGVANTAFPSAWANYGTYNANFTVVSDKVLGFGVYSSQATKESWNSKNSELFSIMQANSDKAYLNYTASNMQIDIYKYGGTEQQVKVLSEKISSTGIRVASVSELTENLTDLSAKASDLVKFMLGTDYDKVDYWTRNLGNNLDNGLAINISGGQNSQWLSKTIGVRFSMTMINGSRMM